MAINMATKTLSSSTNKNPLRMLLFKALLFQKFAEFDFDVFSDGGAVGVGGDEGQALPGSGAGGFVDGDVDVGPEFLVLIGGEGGTGGGEAVELGLSGIDAAVANQLVMIKSAKFPQAGQQGGNQEKNYRQGDNGFGENPAGVLMIFFNVSHY